MGSRIFVHFPKTGGRAIQKAYHLHVGPDKLLKIGVSASPRPDLTPELKRTIETNNPFGFSVYNRISRTQGD